MIRHDAGDEPSQGIGPAASADLGPSPPAQLAVPAPPPSQWQFSFTPYLWLPWMTGDVVVKGRTLDVSVDPAAHRPSRLARYRAGVDEPLRRAAVAR